MERRQRRISTAWITSAQREMMVSEVARSSRDSSTSRFEELYWVDGEVLFARLRKKAVKVSVASPSGMGQLGY